jgi:predicted transcriptional regulator
MDILNQLSSQAGDRTEASNRRVVAQCLTKPALLAEIAEGLQSKDAALLGDCAEVMTEVAKEYPEWVVPYAEALVVLLAHKKARVRWEAMHALALVASLAPGLMASLLPRLAEMLRSDSSVIVRDHAVDALGNYAQTSPEAAWATCPYLKEALGVWKGKHAARALNGLSNVVSSAPELAGKLRALSQRYLDDRRGVVRKAARGLVQVAESVAE